MTKLRISISYWVPKWQNETLLHINLNLEGVVLQQAAELKHAVIVATVSLKKNWSHQLASAVCDHIKNHFKNIEDINIIAE